MPSFTPASNRLPAIDALRGIAALGVVVFHYSGHSQRYFTDFPFHFTLGKYGVELFFVISGFFIYSTVEKVNSVGQFAWQRVSRLYPAYWSVLLLLLGLDLAQGRSPWAGGYVTNATMFQAFMGWPDLDIVFWSLAVELAFYLLMGALLATGLLKHLLVVSAAWLGASLSLQLCFPLQAGQSSGAIKPFTDLLVYAPYFVGGLMLYRIHRKEKGQDRRAECLLLLASAGTAWICMGNVAGGAALLFFVAVHAAANGSLRVVVWPLTTWLGAISYALYLVHRNLGYELMFLLNAKGLDSRWAAGITLCVAAALASAITYAIEQPSLRILRRRPH